jgi:hypothetical protein
MALGSPAEADGGSKTERLEKSPGGVEVAIARGTGEAGEGETSGL